MTDTILDEIFAELDPRVVPLFTFIRETGCRREEALSLRWPQIEPDYRTVVFTGRTKSGKSRRVPLTRRAVAAIKRMPRLPESNYVFYHPDSETRWNECRKPWVQAREAAGHEWVQVKDMRRAFGIRLAEAGCPMHFIQAVLGHASVTTTERYYARFSPESASRAVLDFLEPDRKMAQTQDELSHKVAQKWHTATGAKGGKSV